MLKSLESLSDATLWRFMDFTKYVAMLHQGALFFTRADQMPDPFEGLYVRHNQVRETDGLRERAFLSCWHENEHESAAMWRIYLSSQDGIALRTTTERLKKALSDAKETLYLGAVRYLDYQRERVPARHELDPFFHKRKSFDYEREVRVLWRADEELDDPGRYIAADLQTLIEEVVISPTSEKWFDDLVSSVTEKYGFELPITTSSLIEPLQSTST